MEKENYQALKEQNEKLEQKLTKRNNEYIFKLKKQLENKVALDRQAEILADMLPKLIDGQKEGKTAVQLFGTVSECVSNLINEPEKEQEGKKLKSWQMWLDNTLILFTVLAIFSSVMSFIPSKNPTSAQNMMRITSLLISSMAGGVVFYYFNKYIYQYDVKGADRSKKPSMGKQMLIMAAGIIAWMFVMQVAMVLPPVINPVFPPAIVVLLGLVAYVVRYYLRKKFGYTSSMFSFSQQPKK